MLFAAGFGTRMGALATQRPKPLIPVAGKPLIEHALALADGIASPVVANTHYLADQIDAHLAGRGIAISHETPDILETGGGLRAALPLLGPGPVFTLNSDAVWTAPNPLKSLAAAWSEGFGALLLLAPAERARGHKGAGDFTLHPDGHITRGGPMVYLGAQIVDPAGLEDIPGQAFSLNLHWDRLIAEGRAFGLEHSGMWCDVGSPEGIAEAEAMLNELDHDV